MIRRYDLRRSDNYPYSGRVVENIDGSGFVNVHTGFPVTSALVAFSSIPEKSEDIISSDDSEISLSENPRIYVHSYTDDGFVVRYDNIKERIEFNYFAV